MSEVHSRETVQPVVVDLSAVILKEQKIPQKMQNVTDLLSGTDADNLINNYVRYSAPEYDPKKHGAHKEAFETHLFNLASSKVQPRSAQIDALLYRATQISYQVGKEAAMSSGAPNQYLSQELKQQIIVLVKQGGSRYADATSAEAFAAWKAAYTSMSSFNGAQFTEEQIAKRKAGAERTLNTAISMGDSGADEY